MWNLLLLCIYAISGTCATPDGIFEQVESINSKQQVAHIAASKSDCGETTLYINPTQRGPAHRLTISIQDIKEQNPASIKIYRGNTFLTYIEIMRLPLSDDKEDVLLSVYAGANEQYASARYCTKAQNVHSTPDPQATISPSLLKHGILKTEISCNLPISLDAHVYTLGVSMLLEGLPRFNIFCKTTEQEGKLFELIYHPDALTPKAVRLA